MVVRLFALMVLGVWVELFEITVVVEIFSPALPDTSGECFQFLPFVFFHKKDIERTLPNELPKQSAPVGLLFIYNRKQLRHFDALSKVDISCRI